MIPAAAWRRSAAGRHPTERAGGARAPEGRSTWPPGAGRCQNVADMRAAGEPPHLDPREVRRRILEQSRRAGVGHIGSALSIVEILCAIFGSGRDLGGQAPDRDLLVLSKGHAALALYVVLDILGIIEPGGLDTYCADGSLLGVHPEHQLDGVDVSTGSLGQGLSMAAGAALGARLAGSPSRVFVLMSDAEHNEGAVWEAALLAAREKALTALEARVCVNCYSRDDIHALIADLRRAGIALPDAPTLLGGTDKQTRLARLLRSRKTAQMRDAYTAYRQSLDAQVAAGTRAPENAARQRAWCERSIRTVLAINDPNWWIDRQTSDGWGLVRAAARRTGHPREVAG